MSQENIGFFKAITNTQTYLNMIYLLISFPLGILYFVFIVTGLSLGFGLFITWLGIPILLGVMFVWLGFAYFERKLSSSILNIEVPFTPRIISRQANLWEKLKLRFKTPYTWNSFVYLLIKFPLGIVSFTLLVTLLSVSISFIASPLLYYLVDIGLVTGVNFCTPDNICFLNSYASAIFLGLVGILMIFVSLAIFNGLAKLSGLLARALLSSRGKPLASKPKKKVKRKKK